MAKFFLGNKAAPTVTSPIPLCGKCGLSRGCLSPRLAASGTGKVKVLFVGAAPGDAEDRQGMHFVGESGERLRQTLDTLNVEVEDCWATYALACRPTHKTKADTWQNCRANLIKTIHTLKPEVIVCLGMEATKSVLQTEWSKDFGTMTRWRRWAIPSQQFNAWVCPTWDAKFVLWKREDPVLLKLWAEDLQMAMDRAGSRPAVPTLKELQNKVKVITDEQRTIKWLKKLYEKCQDPNAMLAFDYETTGIKPDRKEQEIASISFCLNGQVTFACLLSDRVKPLVSDILRSPAGKLASNMKFEERWTLKKFGHPVRNWQWDTMLVAHLLDNQRASKERKREKGATSLKFQTFVQFGIGDYDSHISPFLKSTGKNSNGKNRIKEIEVRDLLLYNGLDSLLEYMLYKRQEELLGL